MKTNNIIKPKKINGEELVEHVVDDSWVYIKTVVDVVGDPVLILNNNLRVMAANNSFYRKFTAIQNNTEGRNVWELGNGEWNIPALIKLLEKVLPHDTIFKGFEVSHKFSLIGNRIMILNAHQIHFDKTTKEAEPQMILLTIEDVTEMMAVAGTVSNHVKQLEVKLAEKY